LPIQASEPTKITSPLKTNSIGINLPQKILFWGPRKVVMEMGMSGHAELFVAPEEIEGEEEKS
jgi:hypothetical protein